MINSTMLFVGMDNKTMLLVLMIVLILFIVLLAVLGIVFIIALRKRTPVVKVVMASNLADEEESEEEQQPQEDITEIFTHEAPEEGVLEESSALVVANNAVQPLGQPVAGAIIIPEEPDEVDDDEEDGPKIVTEGQETVRYSRSFVAKLCQLKDETKEWYSQLKNDLLSYERVKTRLSWRKETFRIGRMTVARIAIRGKTLCLMIAVEPAGYSGTKYSVEDVSNVAATSDTPTLYRIKSERKLKYAKEMIAGLMKEIKIYKDPRYEGKDYFLPYEGDMSLMHRGLVKRIVTGTTRTFKIEEIDPSQVVDVEPTDSESQITIEPAEQQAVEEPVKETKKAKSKAAATKAQDTDNNDDKA